MLRWSSPVAFWTRSTKVDVEMDGVTIPKGERVVAMLRSANRDEEVFDNPFTFDIGRAENPHVTFGGGGPHHCLGAMLARAEIRAVLDELLCRADDISLGPPKVAYPNLTNNMSIFDEMAITLTAALASQASQSLRPGADDVCGGQPLQIRVGEPTQLRQHLAVVLPERRRRAKQPLLGAVEPGERRTRVQARPGSRMLEALEEAAVHQLRVLGHQ